MELEGDTDGLLELEGDTEGLTDAEGDTDGLTDGLLELEGDTDGLTEEEGVLFVKSIQDNAPSSLLFPPVQVTAVADNDVTLVAVVNSNAPTFASISSVAFAHVFVPAAVAPAATARKPPPVAIVIAPVVSASLTSISLDASLPALEYAASLTLYTAIWFCDELAFAP